LRALDTARIACDPLGVEVEVSDALRGGDFDPGELAAGRGEVLLVGHEPDFSRAIQLATGGRVEMKKGGLAAIDGPVLTALLRPEQIKRIH
jgi:phosphohistidine phosphatase